MRSDQRYIVREAIRREQGEPVRRETREYREYGRREEDEPPRREVREYERREYREPAPPYSGREPEPYYSDRESDSGYQIREQRSSYPVRETEGYPRRETRSSYPPPQIGVAYPPRQTAVSYPPESATRRPVRDRPQTREDWPPAKEENEESETDQPVAPAWFAVTRATSLFLGCVTLLNLVGEMRFPHFSAAGWWIDLHFLPKPASRGLLALSAVLLVAFAFFPRANGIMRRLGALCTLGLLGAAGWSVYRFYHHDHAGQGFRDVPIPFALHVVALLAVALPGQLTGWWERTNFFKDFLIGTMTLATCAAAFPLAHFVSVGQHNNRDAADVAVVFAARIDTEKAVDGKSSPNPLQAACQLYREGHLKKILLIVRPNESGTQEETATLLRHAAVADGVAESDLLSPPSLAASGEARGSVVEAAKFLDDQKLSHVLIVARSLEVPRIQLSFQRAGLETQVAPVREDLRTAQMRPVLVREAVALWTCYLQPVL
jgi:vancomycin permeability regulator SanA